MKIISSLCGVAAVLAGTAAAPAFGRAAAPTSASLPLRVAAFLGSVAVPVLAQLQVQPRQRREGMTPEIAKNARRDIRRFDGGRPLSSGLRRALRRDPSLAEVQYDDVDPVVASRQLADEDVVAIELAGGPPSLSMSLGLMGEGDLLMASKGSKGGSPPSAAKSAKATQGKSRKSTKKATDKVCIVGGGPSGLTAALRLRDKGFKDVVLFEKEEAIGGRTQNWIDPDGGVQNKGAILFIRPFYSETLALMARFGLTGTEWQVPDVTYFYNKDLPFVIDRTLLPGPDPLEVGAQLVKYATLYQGWATEFVPGYPGGVSPELSAPMLALLNQYDLLLLAPLFHAIATVSGYGSLEITPAIYMIQVVHPALLIAFASGQSAVDRVDYEALFHHVAEESQADIRLKAEITELKYGPDKVHVKYLLDGIPQNQKCDHLIHAIPSYNSEDDNIFRFDQGQKEVLHQLVYEPYWTVFAKMSELNFGERYSPVLFPSPTGLTYEEFEGVGEPIFTFNQFPTASYATLYSWHKPPLPESFSIDDVNAQVQQYLGWLELNKDEDGNPIPIEIEATFEWTYFPHVNTTAINNGWYQELEGLQGHRNTYFTGGYRSMDTVESVVRSAYDIVDRFFDLDEI